MQLFDSTLGLLKLIIYKLFYLKRLSFNPYIKFSCGAHIRTLKNARIELGKASSYNNGTTVSATQNASITIGEYSGFGRNTIVVARHHIKIGDNVLIGPNVCIYDHDHVFKTNELMKNSGYETAPVIIEDDVWVGAGAIILKGVTIGHGSVIGAGTLINKNVPPNSLVYDKRTVLIKRKIIE